MTTQKITISKYIQAAPFVVYASFTTAEGWCTWCCEKAEVEAAVGGKLHIYTDGYNAYGEYIVLEPDRVVSFSWNGDKEPPTQIQISLEKQDEGSLVTFTVIILEPDADETDFANFLERIWGRALDNLKTVLESQTMQTD